MELIKAEKIGIKFKLNYEKRNTLKSTLEKALLRNMPLSKEFWALRDISFSLKKGEVLGLIGRNGSGKSTLLRLIGGIYVPDEGNIRVNGTVSSLLSLTVGFQQGLSGLDNIYLNGVLMGFKEREIDTVLEDIIEFSELEKFIEVPIKTYSSGMLARLGFSIAINLKRDIMLVDEILGVGDARFRPKCDKAITELMNEGRTVVLVSHNMESIKQFADKVLWLEKGVLKAEGPAVQVVEQYLKF